MNVAECVRRVGNRECVYKLTKHSSKSMCSLLSAGFESSLMRNKYRPKKHKMA